MASLGNPPAFVGKISISSTNDKVYWDEFSPLVSLSSTMPHIEMYPSELCMLLENAMNAESLASGNGETYSCSFSKETGKITISSTADFLISNLTTDVNDLWSGGGVDSGGLDLKENQVFKNHIGFSKDPIGVLFTQSTTETGLVPVSNYWKPSIPPSEIDTHEEFENIASEAVSLSGEKQVYDYVTSLVSADFYDKGRQQHEYRQQGYKLIMQDSRDQFIYNFWLPYARKGKAFKLFEKSTNTDFRVYSLTKESILKASFSERRDNYPIWNGSLSLKRENDHTPTAPAEAVALFSNAIDMSVFFSEYRRSLTESTTFTVASGVKTGFQTLLWLDGDFVLTLPSGTSVISGAYDGTLGRINKVLLTCTDDTSGAFAFDAEITTQDIDTSILRVWELNEGIGTTTSSQATDHDTAIVSSAFSGGMTWEASIPSDPKIGLSNKVDFSAAAGVGFHTETSTFGGAVSFVLWTKSDALTGYSIFLTPPAYDPDVNRIGIFFDALGQAGIIHWDGVGTIRQARSAPLYSVATEYCLICSLKADGNVTVMVDGVLVASGYLAPLNNVAREIWLGKNPESGLSVDGEINRFEIVQGEISVKQAEFITNQNRGNSLGVSIAS